MHDQQACKASLRHVSHYLPPSKIKCFRNLWKRITEPTIWIPFSGISRSSFELVCEVCPCELALLSCPIFGQTAP